MEMAVHDPIADLKARAHNKIEITGNLETIMSLEKPKYLIVAIFMLLGGAVGASKLYQSRDWSKDYYGPILLIVGLLWLYGAFRKPSSSANER